ncbi:MAG: rRNA (cytosine1402-N4)-methyltransferase [Actinomycetota bacterium]|jgi:16S rRNA (cytosine1402-N4)-methyltransferase|nr:rRNA (cytosine1402-N4)-methyltransferase [Actinomycetota bacterium]MEA2486429.1 rRNA (cytosine1402-N4)-methyltransferase [Actinomycetota bacterium]
MGWGGPEGHEPVLRAEVVDLLLPALEHGGVVVDATLGGGGHTDALLAAAPAITVVGIDRDPEALDAARSNLGSRAARVTFVRDDYARIAAVLERLGIEAVAGVLFDLGVSSPQLDRAERGFSFRNDGPLDMRMDPTQELTARDVVNGYPERDLARVIRTFGEERFAARVARAIVHARPIESTVALADTVKEAIPAATRRTGGHPARRTFQAIRIEVNKELESVSTGVSDAIEALAPGGRIAVISYHSLEDRIVKKALTEAARGCTCPPDFPVCTCGAAASIRILTRRPARPPESEQARNPRASAAKLRAAQCIRPSKVGGR